MAELYEDRVGYKDPDENLDFKFDWSPWLDSLGDSDTILSDVWEISPVDTLVETASGNDSTTTTVWLSGGDVNHSYLVTNRITTDGGRIADRTMVLHIRDK